MHAFKLDTFIDQYVTSRPVSLFEEDVRESADRLNAEIAGKSVLVIGGAGTIGSSYIKAILKFKPGRLFVIDINENGLTELVRDIRSEKDGYVPKDFITYPINFSDPIFRKIYSQEGPFDIVANFAAHKHVRSEKDHYSIEAMIDNNVLKAKGLLELLAAYPPKHFFCVSTDKATNPVNVMGASKKLMEDVLLAYSDKLKVSTSRFANVAFSNGSLLFGFQERLAKQQAITVPQDVRRYFVSPKESGELCMLSCILGATGEIFFPKLPPEQMKPFTSIAVDFLHAHGYEPFYCNSEEEARNFQIDLGQGLYPVYFFNSDTSGEKPYEEFFADDEETDLTSYQSVGIVKNVRPKALEELESVIEQINLLFRQESLSKQNIVAVLKEIMPGFNHIETGKSLDQRM